ncbi:MAG: hypothetical protein ETSY1_20540 [Candidatus Entotheonella factor]|uniref:BON domain-containing protein n=1 Tax=Entotheonella factor TaxID=1429438 RepID=W4LJ24_ENTF1|nr:BON domain-containing protein [Candidatus Entotheonella palauensis]ETW97982.1 MAG: hypothetical protein ETSY1_20540 [Candidatus Entotheonella factor]
MIHKSFPTKLMICLMVVASVSVSFPVYGANETELRQRIQDQVQSDDQLEGTEVRIAVKGGDVVLSGTVRLYSQKMRYEQLVWRTPGVMDVDNELRVRPHGLIADRDIKSHILNLKHKYPRFQASVIQVTVNKGHISVNGTFHDASDVLFLKHRIAEIEGVIQIEIEVQYAA